MKSLLIKEDDRDEWLGRTASVTLHAIFFALLSFQPFNFKAERGRTVLLTVETVSGLTPFGWGSGVEGVASQISNQPPNLNPLAGALQLKMNETALHAPQPSPKRPAPKTAARPQASAVSDAERVRIGLDPRQGRESSEISEGGMGNNQAAGTAEGIPGLSSAFGGRGYVAVDFSYPGSLPEESENELILVVSPLGEVAEVRLARTTGYFALDQHVLARARELRFAPLPPGMPQENQVGRVPFVFKFSGEIVLK